MERCKYELFVENYFGFNTDEVITEKTKITTDFGQLVNILAMFDNERGSADTSHELSGLNKPVVTVSLPLSNEQILKGIQTSPRYQLPQEWLKNEHANSNYMGGFLNAVKWMEGNAW